MGPWRRGPGPRRRRRDRQHDAGRDRALAHRSHPHLRNWDLRRRVRDLDPWRRLSGPVRSDRHSLRSRVHGRRTGLRRREPIAGRHRRAGPRRACCHGPARPPDAGHRLSRRRRQHDPLPVRPADPRAVAAHRRPNPPARTPSRAATHADHLASSRPRRARLHGRLLYGKAWLPGGAALDHPPHGALLVRRLGRPRLGPVQRPKGAKRRRGSWAFFSRWRLSRRSAPCARPGH